MAEEVAVVVGVGPGLSASLARLCAREGMKVAVAARNADKLSDLARETGGRAYSCDASEPEQVASLFAQVDSDLGTLDFVVFNVGHRYRGPIEALEPERVREALMVESFGGFLVAQEAARRMLPRGKGSIFLTGATASVKGYPESTPFAMGKFALRGLAQCLARELAPKGLHVAHFIIDGGIGTTFAGKGNDNPPDRWLDPDAIAETYLHVHRQHRSAWTWEVELRPWVENF